MKPQRSITAFLRTGIVILLLASCVQAAGATSRVVPVGGTVVIGETDLDMTRCILGDTIGWWPNPADVNVTTPSRVLTVASNRSYNVSRSDFTDSTGFTYTGTWYNVNPVSGRSYGIAFRVAGSPPSPPVALNDSYTVKRNTVLRVPPAGVLKNDYDPAGGRLRAVKAASPGHGTVLLNADGSFTYIPARSYTGTDSFTYRAYDGTFFSDTAIVKLTIR